MTRLRFPAVVSRNENSSFLNNDEREHYKCLFDDLDRRISELAKKYLKSPLSVTQSDVKVIIVESYRETVRLFEIKISRGITLLPDERDIYELCRREVKNESAENSILGFILNAIERGRDCIEETMDWFGLSTSIDKANLYIGKVGDALLPEYRSLIASFFTEIDMFFTYLFEPTIFELGAGQLKCAISYQKVLPVEKHLSSTMLRIANYAYTGNSQTASGAFSKLPKDRIPEPIRILYDDQTGLLKSSRGLQAWLGEKGNDIVISFSGTDITSIDMLYADIIQLSSPSTLYLKAAGLLKMMIDSNSNKNIYVAGHSLGGGLSQFALTANQNVKHKKLTSFAYNPAGLSMVSLDHLRVERLRKAVDKSFVFMTCYDPVSTFGGKIGNLVTLPKTTKNGHGMGDLAECMKAYVQGELPDLSSRITMGCRNYSEGDFIPYAHKISLVDNSSNVYPIFNDNPLGNYSHFLDIVVSSSLFSKLNVRTSISDHCMGVYNKFNGTGHTVMNRLLLLSDNKEGVTTNLFGNIQSTMMFGKFGLGIRDFIELIKKAYVDSNEMFTGNKCNYEKALGHLSDPFEFDKNAWIDGIRITFDINLVDDIFNKYPTAEDYFNSWLVKLTSDRIDIYQSIFKGTAPTREDKLNFVTQLQNLVINSTAIILQEAVYAGGITQEQMKHFKHYISGFCKIVKDTY